MKHDKCTGCRACEQVCPQKCISMKYDKEGFLYPVIDEDRCISCGQCKTRCQIDNYSNLLNPPHKVLAGFSKHKEILFNSSSGGIYPELAKEFIGSEKGVVFATARGSDGLPEHQEILKIEDIAKTCKSCYTQGDTCDSYKRIKEYLNNRVKVLFVGTPCQVMGLKLYIGDNNPGFLYTIDIFCHGTPSPVLYKKHLNYLSENNKTDISDFEFRRKINLTDNLYRYSFKKADKICFGPYYKDPYYDAFIHSLNYRECCYQCEFARPERVGDISIGDYRGGWSHHPGFKPYFKNTPNLNLSSILINSEKGEALINKIAGSCALEETKIEWINEFNSALKASAVRPTSRSTFYGYINDVGYSAWANEYINNPKRKRQSLISDLKNSLIYQFAKKTIKKYMR